MRKPAVGPYSHLTQTLNSLGALSIVPVGESDLGMCSREKALGLMIPASWMTM